MSEQDLPPVKMELRFSAYCAHCGKAMTYTGVHRTIGGVIENDRWARAMFVPCWCESTKLLAALKLVTSMLGAVARDLEKSDYPEHEFTADLIKARDKAQALIEKVESGR